MKLVPIWWIMTLPHSREDTIRLTENVANGQVTIENDESVYYSIIKQ